MTALQRRFRKIVQRLGEPYVSGGDTRTGIFAPMSSGFAGTYLTSAELGAAARPIRVAYVAFDDPTLEGAALTWNGYTLTVKRAIQVRFRGTTVARMLVLV
ncbi:MAG TPA: hypothetical protein VGE01_09720 [Fimbriimonas sp.]